MIGNISKSKGFKGDRGYIGIQGIQGIQGEKGDTANIYLRYDALTGNLYYSTEYVPSLKTAPYIGENGNWYVFDGKEKIFIDTGINAQGGVPIRYIDEYIDNQTAIIKSDIKGIQQQIQEESHFRGYLSTNAKIQALEATPNDFAYSAESGTVWIYDAEQGWQNTSTPVPDKGTPLSNATPLINGIASAGTSEEGARSDHRHPTDTTRASGEEFRQLSSTVDGILNDIKPLKTETWDLRDKLIPYIFFARNTTCVMGTFEGLELNTIPVHFFDYSGDNSSDYEASVVFSTGNAVLPITHEGISIAWAGEDCSEDGYFYPQLNTTYELQAKKLIDMYSIRVGIIVPPHNTEEA